MRPIQTRFRCASGIHLKLHYRITRWIVLQKARRHGTSPLRLLVGTQFQVLFHSPPGVLFTFPSRYSFTIDHVVYLALGGGPPRFSQGFTCPDLLKKIQMISKLNFQIRGFHSLRPSFPACSFNQVYLSQFNWQ